MSSSSSSPCFIASLPEDVLLEIFLYLYKRWPMREIRSELAVCRQWNSLIMNSPLLWTRIRITDRDGPRHRQSLVDLANFERSGNALLDVYIDIESQLPDLQYELFARHSLRVGTLDIYLPPEQEAFSSIFGRGWGNLRMPHLTRMSITADNFDWEDSESGESGGGMVIPPFGLQSLVRLSLSNFPFELFPPTIGLRSLRLDSVDAVKRDTLQQLFAFFPQLEELLISAFIPQAGNLNPHTGPDDRGEIHAPFLRILAIGSPYPHYRNCICGLHLLVAPEIELVEFHGSRHNYVNDSHGRLLTRSAPTKPRRLRVCMYEYFTRKEVRFFATLPGHVDLELGYLPADSTAFILALLQTLPNLRSLTFPLREEEMPESDYGDLEDTVLNPVTFASLVRRYRPVLASPTFIQIEDPEWLPEDVQHILGEKLTVIVGPRERWVEDECGHIEEEHQWTSTIQLDDEYLEELAQSHQDGDNFSDEEHDLLNESMDVDSNEADDDDCAKDPKDDM